MSSENQDPGKCLTLLLHCGQQIIFFSLAVSRWKWIYPANYVRLQMWNVNAVTLVFYSHLYSWLLMKLSLLFLIKSIFLVCVHVRERDTHTKGDEKSKLKWKLFHFKYCRQVIVFFREQEDAGYYGYQPAPLCFMLVNYILKSPWLNAYNYPLSFVLVSCIVQRTARRLALANVSQIYGKHFLLHTVRKWCPQGHITSSVLTLSSLVKHFNSDLIMKQVDIVFFLCLHNPVKRPKLAMWNNQLLALRPLAPTEHISIVW